MSLFYPGRQVQLSLSGREELQREGICIPGFGQGEIQAVSENFATVKFKGRKLPVVISTEFLKV